MFDKRPGFFSKSFSRVYTFKKAIIYVLSMIRSLWGHSVTNKLRLVIDQTPSAIFILDKNFKFEYVNSGYEKLIGLSQAELLGKSVFDVFDRTELSESKEKIMQNMLAGQKWEGETLTLKKGDSTYWINAFASPFRDRRDRLEGYFFILQDITDQKKVESYLRESETKYKTLVENSHDGIVIVHNERAVYANDTICKMLGYSPVEQSFNTIHQEDRHILMQIGERRRQGDASAIHAKIRLVTKSGEVRICEAISTVVEYNGEFGGFYTIHDVTEQNRIEQELMKSEHKYRELAEMLPIGVYELDLDARIKYINYTGRKLFHLTEDSYMDLSAMSFFSSKDSVLMRENLEQEVERLRNINYDAGEETEAIPVEFTAKRSDGSEFPVLLYVNYIQEEKKVIGFRGIIIDISERKAMENALRESEEKYRLLIEKATDGVVITQDGLMKFSNKAMADMLKLEDVEEEFGHSFLDRIHPEDHQIMIDFHKRRMQGEDFVALYRSRMIRNDGQMITVEFNSRTSIYNGRPAAFNIIRDITDRVKIEEELKKAKIELEKLNNELKKRVKDSSRRLTEAQTQLINLQKENLQSQYEVLKQQVNPHFLFNSLNVLTSLIKIEPDLAEKFSEQLSKVYRYVLENKDNELVDLNTELNFLEAYIFLLNIRFMDKLEVRVNISESRRYDKIIPLAMQLLIENAIKHNIMSRSNPLLIDIFIDDSNYLNVINNLQKRPSMVVSTGIGLKNILNRYQLLNLPMPLFEKTETQFIAKIHLVGGA